MRSKEVIMPHGCEFTVCALLYGNYPHLARRCLTSLARLAAQKKIDLRIGANEISASTRGVLEELGLMRGDEVTIIVSKENLKKYPMMRKLFAWPSDVRSPFTMWFDDDSYIKEDPAAWLSKVSCAMEGADMLGSVYNISLTSNQRAWVRQQPWYAGSEPRAKASFCTGGWWTIRTEILKKFGWPIQELLHRGGDVMLGELCRQQGFRIRHFRDGVAINADERGRESKAPRRGFDSAPVGADYRPSSSG